MSKEKKSPRLAGVILTSVLSLGLGAGGYWFYQNSIANAGTTESSLASLVPSSKSQALIPDPIFVDIEPITVTLKDGRATRVLYLGLTVQMQDEISRARLERYLPVARSRIITELSDIDPALLTERETKDSIRAVVATALEAPFTAETQRQQITDVLFSAYVVQ